MGNTTNIDYSKLDLQFVSALQAAASSMRNLESAAIRANLSGYAQAIEKVAKRLEVDSNKMKDCIALVNAGL